MVVGGDAHPGSIDYPLQISLLTSLVAPPDINILYLLQISYDEADQSTGGGRSLIKSARGDTEIYLRHLPEEGTPQTKLAQVRIGPSGIPT